MVPPKCFCSRLKPNLSFKCEINHGTLLDAPATIFLAKRNMANHVEHKKTLAAFRRPPDDDYPLDWNNALHEISGCGRKADVSKAGEFQPVLVFAVLIGAIISRLLLPTANPIFLQNIIYLFVGAAH